MIQVVSDGDHGGESFEERLRALARGIGQSVERVVNGDVDRDRIADQIRMGGDRVRELAEFAGRWVTDVVEGSDARSSSRPEPGVAGDRRLPDVGGDGANFVVADCHPAVRILVICLLRNRDLRWAHSTQAGGRWRLGPTS